MNDDHRFLAWGDLFFQGTKAGRGGITNKKKLAQYLGFFFFP